MKKKIIIAVVIVAVILLIVWRLASNKHSINVKSQSIDTATIAIPVKVDTIRVQMIDLSIIQTGTITPFRESKVLSTGSANITQVSFSLGSKVVKGQVLAVLDNRGNTLELQNAQANASKLKGDLQTYQDLLEGKATTAQKVKDLQQNYNEALNQVSQIQKQAGDAYIKAPISGVITSKNVEAGLFASPGTEVATIVDLSQSKVQVYVSEAEVYQINEGQQVKITADVFPGKEFTGKVNFISPQADETHNYLVEITLNNSGKDILRSGTFIKAEFPSKAKSELLLIPSQAISGTGKETTVYVVLNKRVTLRKITSAREVNGLVEVTEGLKPGDVVVVSGQINLKDGTLIRVSQ